MCINFFDKFVSPKVFFEFDIKRIIINNDDKFIFRNLAEISSSDLHIRKKRIIDNSQHPTIVKSIKEVPYVVSIHKNENLICGGSILSSYLILTAVTCIGDAQEYHISSGSSNVSLGIRHEIRRKILYAPVNTISEEKNLLLLIIYPPIDFRNSPSRPIELHSGAISLKSLLGARTYGTLSGWGCINLIP